METLLMDRTTISDTVRVAVAEILEIAPEEIGPRMNFFTDLEMDSLASLELVMMLEQKFKIHILEEELTSLVTLDGILDVVSRRMEAES